MTDTIQLTLPNGDVREYATGTTGLDVAASIGKGLAKAAVAIRLDGADEPQSLQLPIDTSAAIEIITRDTPAGLEVLRHSAAHVLADAVKRIRPGAKLWKGPPIDDPRYGFYYDIDLGDRAARRRATCRSSRSTCWHDHRRGRAVRVLEELPRERGQAADGRHHGEDLQARDDRQDPRGRSDHLLHRSGEFVDLCKGPHVPTTGKIGNGIAVLSHRRCYFE